MINRWLGKEFDGNQVGQSRNEVEIEERAMENAGSQKANKIDTYKNEDGVKNQQKKSYQAYISPMNSVVEAYFRQDQLQITVFYYKYYTYINYNLMFMNVFNGKNILFTDKKKK